MVSPAPAVCSDTECPNNANAKTTECCASCGKCGEHFHQDCASLDNTLHGRPDPLLEG